MTAAHTAGSAVVCKVVVYPHPPHLPIDKKFPRSYQVLRYAVYKWSTNRLPPLSFSIDTIGSNGTNQQIVYKRL